MVYIRSQAVLAYQRLSNSKAPVFFGKDIIYESMKGYEFAGQIPVSIFLRQKLLFQSGICEFWNNFLEYFMVVRENSGFGSDPAEKIATIDRDLVTARNILVLIPGAGLFICFLIFLVENNLILRNILIIAKQSLVTCIINVLGAPASGRILTYLEPTKIFRKTLVLTGQ